MVSIAAWPRRGSSSRRARRLSRRASNLSGQEQSRHPTPIALALALAPTELVREREPPPHSAINVLWANRRSKRRANVLQTTPWGVKASPWAVSEVVERCQVADSRRGA